MYDIRDPLTYIWSVRGNREHKGETRARHISGVEYKVQGDIYILSTPSPVIGSYIHSLVSVENLAIVTRLSTEVARAVISLADAALACNDRPQSIRLFGQEAYIMQYGLISVT